MTVLQTQRLILRQVVQEDQPAVAQMLGDPKVTEYDSMNFRKPEAAQLWIDRIRERYVRDGHCLWALERKSEPGFVGLVGVINPNVPEVSDLEIGWHLMRAHWGHGFAREAAIACREYGFSQLKKDRMISMIRPGNQSSIRVAESIGMRLEKVLFVAKYDREIEVYSVAKKS